MRDSLSEQGRRVRAVDPDDPAPGPIAQLGVGARLEGERAEHRRRRPELRHHVEATERRLHPVGADRNPRAQHDTAGVSQLERALAAVDHDLLADRLQVDAAGGNPAGAPVGPARQADAVPGRLPLPSRRTPRASTTRGLKSGTKLRQDVVRGALSRLGCGPHCHLRPADVAGCRDARARRPLLALLPSRARSASARQATRLARDGRRLEDADDTDSPRRAPTGLVRHPDLGDARARRPHRDRDPAAAVRGPLPCEAGAVDQDADAADAATLVGHEHPARHRAGRPRASAGRPSAPGTLRPAAGTDP